MSDLDDLDDRDRALALRLRAQLRSREDLDYLTQAKLSAARARAVAGARHPSDAPRHTGWWVATGGLTAAVLLAVVLVLRAPHSMPTTDALELLTDDVDPEFYQDLDLYQWLADTGAGSA